jgi:hypothetical protein
MLKIVYFGFSSIIFIFFPLSSSKAGCIKKSITNETIIECETKETSNYYVAGFVEKNSKTTILPSYDNSLYVILEITGININTDNHSLDIGNSQNSINPRIDVIINSLNNKVGNEIINIFGTDLHSNYSSLYIKNLKNEYGNLTINAEIKNKVNIDNSIIQGYLSLKNTDTILKNISVNDIFLNNTNLKLDNNGIVNIQDIYIDKHSSISIASNGSIASIYSIGDIFFSGSDSIIRANRIDSSGDIILENNMEVIIDEIVNNNKIIFLGEGKLTSQKLNLKEINIKGEGHNLKFNHINVFNDVTTDNIYLKDVNLDLLANKISVNEGVYLERANFNIQSDMITDKVELNSSFINSNQDLRTSSMILKNSKANFKDISINSQLFIENSLLYANKVNFISFSGNSSMDIILSEEMLSQGTLKTGIYAEGDINIVNNVALNLTFLDSRGIKESESMIYELLYSKNGTISYNPYNFGLYDSSDILDIHYYQIKEQGTSFVVEIKRVFSYCDALAKAGKDCNSSSNIKYTGDTFVSDTAKILDEIIQQGVPVTNNLSILISALDKSSLETLEGNLMSLKPISNDVLLFENYQNSKFIKGLHTTNSVLQSKFSVFSSNGKIEDNIFDSLSATTLLGAYYGFAFDNNVSFGFALNQSNISNYMYDIDNFGLMLLSSYKLNIKAINLDFMGTYGINKYDRSKINFNNSKSDSSSILNNVSFRFSIYQDYKLEDIKVSPKFYYDIGYLSLGGYKERGEGYLYEVLDSKSLISELNAGLEASYKILKEGGVLSASLNIFYLSYSSDNLFAKPYEVSENYILFEKAMYTGLGFSANLGIDVEIKNTNLNISYNGYFYENNSFFNGLTMSVSL